MVKSAYIRSAFAAMTLVLVSVIGFGTAFGYGGSRSGGHANPSPRIPVVTTAPSPAVLGDTTFKFNMDLRQGMNSNDVIELQKRLRAEGFFTFPTDTGYFGPITFASVKAYQAAHPEIGYVTGFCGPLTRASLNK